MFQAAIWTAELDSSKACYLKTAMCFHGPCGRHQYDFTQPRFLLGIQTKPDQVAEFAEVATEESTVKVFLYRILLHPTAPSSTELDNRLLDDSLANSAT